MAHRKTVVGMDPDAGRIGRVAERAEQVPDPLSDLEYHGTVEGQHHDLGRFDVLLANKMDDPAHEHGGLPRARSRIHQQVAVIGVLHRRPLRRLRRGAVEIEELRRTGRPELVALLGENPGLVRDLAQLLVHEALERIHVGAGEVTAAQMRPRQPDKARGDCQKSCDQHRAVAEGPQPPAVVYFNATQTDQQVQAVT